MRRKLGPQILTLKAEGKTHSEISKLLDCNINTVSYYCSPNRKAQIRNQTRKRRKKHPYIYKIDTFIVKSKSLNTFSYSNYKSKEALYSKTIKFLKRKKTAMTKHFTYQDVIDKFGENPKCYLTGEPINIWDTKSYHFDHIIPPSKGGTNTLDNLGICTKDANRCKSDLTPDELIIFCKKVLMNKGFSINHNAES